MIHFYQVVNVDAFRIAHTARGISRVYRRLKAALNAKSGLVQPDQPEIARGYRAERY